MSPRHSCWAVYALIAIGAGSGCARPPQVAEVVGQVTVDRAPHAKILVAFIPEGTHSRRQLKSSAVTDEQGKFRLRCEDGRDGAVIGPHRVVLEDITVYYLPRNDSAPPISASEPARVPSLYRAATTTPLRFDVREGENEANFEIAP